MTTEIKVLGTTAIKTTLDALADEFVRAGYKVNGSYGPSQQIAQRVADGETADVAIVTAAGHDALTRDNKLRPGLKFPVAHSGISIAVRAGAPRPDVSTPEAFKHAMLDAKTVAMSNPVGGGQSGVIVMNAFKTLGIVDAMKAKTVYGQGGPAGLIGLFLVRGEADIGIQQHSELMAVPGVDILGPLPGDLQVVTEFCAGEMTDTAHPGAAAALAAVLRTPVGIAVIRKMGLEPA